VSLRIEREKGKYLGVGNKFSGLGFQQHLPDGRIQGGTKVKTWLAEGKQDLLKFGRALGGTRFGRILGGG